MQLKTVYFIMYIYLCMYKNQIYICMHVINQFYIFLNIINLSIQIVDIKFNKVHMVFA